MNKYKEAYESVYQLICELEKIKTGVDAYCVYDEDLEVLKELVEKETPKKIQFNVPQQPFLRKKYGKNARYDGICPSCHKSIFPGYKYCPNCGQKLRWEDEKK